MLGNTLMNLQTTLRMESYRLKLDSIAITWSKYATVYYNSAIQGLNPLRNKIYQNILEIVNITLYDLRQIKQYGFNNDIDLYLNAIIVETEIGLLYNNIKEHQNDSNK